MYTANFHANSRSNAGSAKMTKNIHESTISAEIIMYTIINDVSGNPVKFDEKGFLLQGIWSLIDK